MDTTSRRYESPAPHRGGLRGDAAAPPATGAVAARRRLRPRNNHRRSRRRVAPGPVMAVDQFADVLNVADAETQRRNLSNVTFATADVHRLKFPDESFDVVHADQGCRTSPIPFGRRGKPGESARRWNRRGPRRGRLGVRSGFPSFRSWTCGVTSTTSGSRRRGAGCGPPVAVVGLQAGFDYIACGQPVVLRDGGDPRMVGRHVGRPDPAFGRGSRAAAFGWLLPRNSNRFPRRGWPGLRRRTVGW